MNAERDASAFFELLFGAEPPGKILICQTNGKRWTTHACLRPADAAHYVAGNVDVFHRVGLVDRRPPTGKRGTEEFTTALTAVWLDIDVNGSPDGEGDMVTGAAPSFEAAVDLHHSVLAPSFVVASGYGAHGYLRLTEPWLLRTDEERVRAKKLVKGWHERIKREARARGMAKFDSVFDLARVLRPVGSLNGKGERPVPVELFDDAGPSYTIEQITAEAVIVEDGAPRAGAESCVVAQDILDRHEDLAKLAARKGTKPGKGSASEWDFALGCRTAEHGYGDDVLGALIRHARHVHGEDEKGDRDDYIELTIKAVRQLVPYVGVDTSLDETLAELTKSLRLGEVGRRAVSTRVIGHGNTAAASIALDDGYSIDFPSFQHVAQPAKLADQLATTVGIATEFSKLHARRVAALVRKTANRREELRDHEPYVDEAMRLLALAQTEEFNFTDQGDRWRMWTKIASTDPEEVPEGPERETSAQRRNREARTAEQYARRVVIPCDGEIGVRFVGASWFQQFVRLRLGASATPHRARQAVLATGWQVRGRHGRIKATNPHADDELIFAFYLVALGWEARQGPGDDG